MVVQCFVLGRNPLLSRAEIVSYLGSRNVLFKELLFNDNTLLLEVYSDTPVLLSSLGGSLFSGTSSISGSFSDIESALSSRELIGEDKFTYAVFSNTDYSVLKEHFKSLKVKAMEKHGHRQMGVQEGDSMSIPQVMFPLFFFVVDSKYYLGILDQSYVSDDTEFRDMNKPVRREELAISPRLSKILVNLSGAKPKDFLLDPFCGIGSILIEALLQDISVVGIDRDADAIVGAKKNLLWLKNNFTFSSKYALKNDDSRTVSIRNVDAIATETPLGKTLTSKPSNKEAQEIIARFERFIIPALQNVRKIKRKGARIAITFPKIRDFSVDYNLIQEETGLKIVVGPIEEFRGKQFIKRDIIVFE